MSQNNEETHQICPICFKIFPVADIEMHANKCIFLNSTSDDAPKRKRSPSPSLISNINLKNSISSSQSSKHSPSQSSKTVRKSLQTKSVASSVANEQTTAVENKADNKLESLNNVPLARRVQPKCLEDFFGQNHVLGKDSAMYSLLRKRTIPNMILWGPPGCGKTSLASVIQEICKSNGEKMKFIGLCAATSNLKEVTTVMTNAKNELKFGKRTVLFMDELHRFNKKQQDVFLIHVEKGDIILIGATTENPSFYINSALLSRCRVVVFEKLQSDDIVLILRRALRLNNFEIVADNAPDSSLDNEEKNRITNSCIKWIADISDGDARIALNNLELALHHNNINEKVLTVEFMQEEIMKSQLLYDRKGEEHYNLISAVHKSIRNSDENAALYWTTRMILSGEDPLFIARRLVRAASEDIGNADPNALRLAISTMQGCQLLGMPEADCLLAQCVIYLARAPKSREADSALSAAKNVITSWKGPQPSVPLHLRNAPTKLMKSLGYGKVNDGEEYNCMPKGLEDVDFFS